MLCGWRVKTTGRLDLGPARRWMSSRPVTTLTLVAKQHFLIPRIPLVGPLLSSRGVGTSLREPTFLARFYRKPARRAFCLRPRSASLWHSEAEWRAHSKVLTMMAYSCQGDRSQGHPVPQWRYGVGKAR